MRLGINTQAPENKGLLEGAGVSAAEGLFALAAVIIFGPMIAFLVILVLVKIWPLGDEILGGLIILSLIGAAAMWFRMLFLHAHANLTAKRNKALVVHETDQGFGYVTGEGVYGYSHGLNQGQLTPINAVAELEEPKPEPPYIHATFAEMVSQGMLGIGSDFVLGFDRTSGQPIRIPELTSLGIGGRQGSGKTVSTLYLMLQSIVKYNGRVRFLVVDPHANVPGDQTLYAKTEALHSFFLTDPFAGGAELQEWMEAVDAEMLARLSGKTNTDTWVIVIDEFASIIDTPEAESVYTVIKRINQQARKVGMFAIISSAEWKADTTGGTSIRNSIVTFLIHSMPEQVARLIVPQIAHQAPTLGVGEAIFWSRDAGRRGMAPYTTAKDAEALVKFYSTRGITVSEENLGVAVDKTTTRLVSPADMHNSSFVVVGQGQDEVELVKYLFNEGLSEPDIAKKLCKCNHGTGLAEAKLRVHGILRGLMH